MLAACHVSGRMTHESGRMSHESGRMSHDAEWTQCVDAWSVDAGRVEHESGVRSQDAGRVKRGRVERLNAECRMPDA